MPGSRSARISICFALAEGTMASSAARAIDRKSTGSISSRSFPDAIRATSRRSSIIRACARALRSMMRSAWESVSGLTSFRSISIRVHPSTAFSGFRISCDTVERNSSLVRSAFSAMTRAIFWTSICLRNSPSLTNRSEMSSTVVTVPITSSPSDNGPIRPLWGISSKPRAGGVGGRRRTYRCKPYEITLIRPASASW